LAKPSTQTGGRADDGDAVHSVRPRTEQSAEAGGTKRERGVEAIVQSVDVISVEQLPELAACRRIRAVRQPPVRPFDYVHGSYVACWRSWVDIDPYKPNITPTD
jgi:hypothetical protein